VTRRKGFADAELAVAYDASVASTVMATLRLVFESGRPIAHVARDLGIHSESLRKWVRQAEADAGERADLLTTNERDR
jgi:hypothetical protein